jgi:hypothetical protein
MSQDIVVGPAPLPADVEVLLSDLISRVGERYEFLNGETAAFWHLHLTLTQHLGEGKK